MALTERIRAARDLRSAAKGCDLPKELWEPLTGVSSRRVLAFVAQQCASSGAAPETKAGAKAAWERYRRTFPPFAAGAQGAVPKRRSGAQGKAKAKAQPAPKGRGRAGAKGRGRGRGAGRGEDIKSH